MTRDHSATADREFDRWYRTARPRLARSLLLFCGGDADVASDAADEAMARAYERWARVSTMASPEGWTFRVGVNVAKRRYRRRGLERTAVDRFRRGRATSWVDPDSADLVSVWEAVARLDERSRKIIAMRYVVGMVETEIADALGIATGTVSSSLTRARQALRAGLEDR